MINKAKRQSKNWKRTFISLISDSYLITKLYKEFKQLYRKRTNEQGAYGAMAVSESVPIYWLDDQLLYSLESIYFCFFLVMPGSCLR
jgi:hypothetical protein